MFSKWSSGVVRPRAGFQKFRVAQEDQRTIRWKNERNPVLAASVAQARVEKCGEDFGVPIKFCSGQELLIIIVATGGYLGARQGAGHRKQLHGRETIVDIFPITMGNRHLPLAEPETLSR